MLETLIAALLLFSSGHLDEAKAREHVEAAVAAQAATGIPAELLLGMGWVESRYNPRSLSYMDCSVDPCKRRTTIWTSDKKPKSARPTWYCGVLQVGGSVPWEECLRLMDDLSANYMTSALHIIEWQNDPYCHHKKGDARLVCALQGYGGGYAAITGNATRYANSVLWAYAKMQHFVRKAAVS